MKTLTSITGTRNKFLNAFIIVLVAFILFTLGAVSLELFSDLPKLNKAY